MTTPTPQRLSLLAAVLAACHLHRPLDRDNNPPGPAGGTGTNWENPPGLAGGVGTSPN